ncbi:MAG: CBS domain-containing protein [Anaerolineae bacterium]|nr:CBS domain-containing protein [Anaerolineae bacterium]
MKAEQIMTREVIAVDQDATVEEVARILITRQINAVPVVNAQQEVVGMVSLNELFPKLKDMRFSETRMAHLFNTLVNISDLPDFYWKTRHLPVKEVMTRDMELVQVDDEMERIAALMAYHNYHSLPVVRGKQLVGIISRSDLIRVAMKVDKS